MNHSVTAADVIVAELAVLGVQHVVLAPGSRSAPLAFSLQAAVGRGQMRLHVRIDERAAGFTALGLARVAGPVAVVTTSGTAVANLHPAVLEAAHAGVPLIVLSADRPHELRGTGANQTTDQVDIFGSAVRFVADVPAPSGRAGEHSDLRNLLGRAVAAATGARTRRPGPIHLNLAFREPLVPDAADWPSATSVVAGQVPGRVQVDSAAVDHSGHGGAPARSLGRGRHTVVVAGDGAGDDARELAEQGGFPLLAEPSSGARGGPNAIMLYRLLLGRPELGGRVERVVVFGRPTLSRPVSALLARRDVEVVVVAPSSDWPDPARNAAVVTTAVRAEPDPAGADWLARWIAADAAARQAVSGVLDASGLTGPQVARELWSATGPGQVVVVASSNPIRDLDLTAPPWFGDSAAIGPRVVANRGLAGIDGTLSTASGVALGSGGFTRVLIGDLAFLHDLGGLLVGPLEQPPELQVVVVNDDGGGIFSLLEQGAPEYSADFERVFGTPHGADIAALCAGYGVTHEHVTDLSRLRELLMAPPPGRSVIEIRTERHGLRDLHARLRAVVDATLSHDHEHFAG
ncbi:2-succinyl-5-enolpyruvyl-6-hydroxy-3-cyclohexene-1-carboxylic-acid synthase [Phytoactinopolyspora limicola]|uniref:2-succinyl-5-enolpyruvyl-6-hydroxy-3- cyclohexene-1-carboxylic-acid synthase n=1 Tax=Phytoactinopolyspora limicola TaxID=2715536 RepID=UPI00140A5A07|nr:2-succinyl-5-enolpyruvyl-6-hydroxy-3-cyclohexene-1-carboxylic-acid synthase [Phytoactinopolyspora limicola]